MTTATHHIHYLQQRYDELCQARITCCQQLPPDVTINQHHRIKRCTTNSKPITTDAQFAYLQQQLNTHNHNIRTFTKQLPSHLQCINGTIYSTNARITITCTTKQHATTRTLNRYHVNNKPIHHTNHSSTYTLK